jgi:hypothetical protein
MRVGDLLTPSQREDISNCRQAFSTPCQRRLYTLTQDTRLASSDRCPAAAVLLLLLLPVRTRQVAAAMLHRGLKCVSQSSASGRVQQQGCQISSSTHSTTRQPLPCSRPWRDLRAASTVYNDPQVNLLTNSCIILLSSCVTLDSKSSTMVRDILDGCASSSCSQHRSFVLQLCSI